MSNTTFSRIGQAVQRAADAARTRLASFAASADGVAAVEFAAVLPVMVIMYLGMTEVGQGVTADRKLTLLARALGDLSAQASTIDDTEMSNIFNAAGAVLVPYDSSLSTMVVSSIVIDGTGKATVCWSNAKNMTPRAKGQVVTLPAGINTPSTTLIMAEASYPYTPTIGYVITGTLKLNETVYMRPRLVPQVTRTGNTNC
jgi:Flp pilus assembly protein TadG